MKTCERTKAALWRLVGFVAVLLATQLNSAVQALPNETSNERRPGSEVDTSLTSEPSHDEDHVDQFQCQVDGRWLPLEWRCDFSEQCLDGQDEFGCVPERCDFGHDLCNWTAQRRQQQQQHQQQRQEPWSPLNQARISGGTWLRYAGAGARRGPTATTTKLPQQRNYNESAVSLQQQRLRELYEKLGKAQGRFLFAPLATAASCAHLVAPFVGQTNSMCRLRFRYALVELAGRRLSGGGFPPMSQGLSLALFARNSNQSSVDSTTAVANPVWSVSLKTGGLGEPREAIWSVGVAELGHLSRAELVFEARLSEPSREAAKISMGDHLTRSDSPAVLVALAELHFVDCAWPQAAPPPQVMEVYLPGGPGSGNELPLMVEPQVECQEGQFQCSSTGLCLEWRKLCNFVNDCMSADGGEDERHQLCSPVVGREDFEPAPKSSSAEPNESSGKPLDWSWLLYPAINGTSLESSVAAADRRQSWMVASNLAQDIIRVRSSSEREPHLPSRDHTFGQHKQGHYLSLDITLKSLRHKAKPEDQVLWLYLDSGWLERTGEETLDCRVKFFYNLISSGEPTSMALPFKIYLALEHYVAVQNGSRLIGTARKLDRLACSHREPYEANPAPGHQSPDDSIIELPGVDFWREANYQVSGLNDNQPFYLRIVVIVRPNNGLGGSGDGGAIGRTDFWNDFKASLSIDDLATHFGCGRLVKDTRELDKFRHIGQRRTNVTVNFNLNDYIQQQLDEPQAKIPWPVIRSRNRFADGSSAIQYEPHKLILCVLAVLVSLLGAIGVIVFVIVPYVERITISYHDQLAMGLSTIDSTPSNSTPNLLDACELINEADWEQVSRRWRRQAHRNQSHQVGDDDNNTMIESLSTALDSRNNSQTTNRSGGDSEPFDLV